MDTESSGYANATFVVVRSESDVNQLISASHKIKAVKTVLNDLMTNKNGGP